ncbi:DUF2948 family protein [Xinfangfangia sp. CPCC 101601]|uniref:DUF2948 family protein n=1 Tax=Pseudogemmobacter lacusdianii TaxID=3069608 RepID=A0ABU0VZS9_9RHOB|nr:DUF2948 family protein [Xinfangfangia sp. CPCC 101601]MDQ2067232.1 DUF2948 family protein [Xinfangfangia sp. CPCC 101601]
MADAKFKDGGEAPLRLLAQEAGDLPVLSALLQDAVLTGADVTYDRRRRRFVALLNRFRWEDREEAARDSRPFERVRSVLTVEDVLSAQVMGIAPGQKDEVLSILSLTWEPQEEGSGRLTLTFAGDGALALQLEALELRLDDVTRPYLAPSGRQPDHGL